MNIKTQTDIEMVTQLEQSVRDLARQREMMLKVGLMTEEEMTEFINEKGEKYGARYKKMNPGELFVDLLIQASEAARRGNERNPKDDM